MDNYRKNLFYHGETQIMAKYLKKSEKKKPIWILWVLLCLLLLAATALFVAPMVMDTLQVDFLSSLTIEAGSALPNAADFLPDEEEAEKADIAFITDMGTINANIPGTYPVQLSCREEIFSATLTVKDTVAPTGQVQDVSLCNPESVKPEDFVTEVQDVTDVTITFEKTPDLTATGSQDVVILLTDTSGNTAKLQAALSIIVDTQAPVIEGVKYMETYVGDAVAYRNGITVTDDQDTAVSLEVDNSAVDLSTPGVYTLTYTATDHAGNSTSVSTSIKVYPKRENHVEPEVIYAAADKLLAQFIRDDMTTRQKVEAVYCWVQMHNQYSNHSDKEDWLQAAYQLLVTRQGDCFSYFALNKLLLQRLDIPTIDVEKVKNYEGDSRHYWLLVSIDGGQTYYHMDNVWSMWLCLVTDDVLNVFSAENRNCFSRDESLYPPTPKESLPYNSLPWDDPAIRNAY